MILPRASKIVYLLALVFSLALAACGSEKRFTGDCAVNEDCSVGFRCKKDGADSAGICVCRSDEACGAGQICNAEGRCQERPSCRSNVDCAEDPGKFCDLKSGLCIERTKCGFDVHCPPGTVCDATQNACVNGCQDSSDCPLYQTCDKTGVGAGALGQCVAGICENKEICDYGELCVGRQCTPSSNNQHCRPCSNTNPCQGTDFCLINSSYDPNDPNSGESNYCGVDCATDPNVCPKGYLCNRVVLLTQDQCTSDAECGGGGRRCAIGEGELRGACTCVNNQDCAFDQIPAQCNRTCGGLGIQPCTQDSECITSCVGTCLSDGSRCNDSSQCQAAPLCNGGRCLNGGACNSAEDCLCRMGRCINTGRACSTGAECNPPCVNGGCELGAACGPIEGLSCKEITGN